MDGVFLSKMELEGKLKALKEYICFLRRLYEEVRICQVPPWESGKRAGWASSLRLWLGGQGGEAG